MVQAVIVLSLTNFRSTLPLLPPSFIPSSSFILAFHMQARWLVLDTYSISPFLQSLDSSCKAKNYCSSITFILMRPKSQLQSIKFGGCNFLFRYFRTPFCPLFLRCLSMPIELPGSFLQTADYLYGPQLWLAEEAFILGPTSQAIMIKTNFFLYQHILP